MDKNYDIFISYRRVNSIGVEHIYDELKDKFNVFFDQEGIHTGEMFENKILSALSSSKVLLLVLTKNACNEFKIRSKGSDWLIKEIKYAKDNNIPILPIIIYNEEDAKEVNLLINKELQQCIPNYISFLPQMQFNKIRLERRARKSDINNLINEIEQGLYNKKIIDTIEPSNNLNKEKNTKRRSYNWKKIFVILLLPIILFLIWLFLFNKPLHEERIPISNNDDPNSLEYIIAETRDINGKWSAWTKEKLTIKDNDEFLYFNLHYYPNEEKFKNARIGMDMVPKNLEASSPIFLNYFFTADNIKPTHSYYQIESLDTIQLTPVSLSWQEKKCQSRTCESNLLGYDSEKEKLNDLFTRGVNLGDIDANKYGNLVVKLHIKHKKQPKSLTVSDSFGKPLKPNSLKSIYGAKKDKNFNWSGWKKQLVINDGDKTMYVEIHYNAYDASLENIRLGLSKFPLNIDANKKINISSFVVADNAQPIIGNISIYSLVDIELIPEKISFQENKCKSVNCETQLPSYSSENEKITDLFKRGITVGNKLKGHYGNLIIQFYIKHKEKISKNNTKLDINQLTTNQSPSSIPTLKVTNKRGSSKRWGSSVHVDSSEILSFQMHYYTGYTGAINLKAKIDNLNGRVFSLDEKVRITAQISSDNLDTSLGTVEVIFDENVQLKFHRVSWQKTNCKDTKCESLITDNINNLFSEQGLDLGHILKDNDKYYSGNLVLEYKVVKVED